MCHTHAQPTHFVTLTYTNHHHHHCYYYDSQSHTRIHTHHAQPHNHIYVHIEVLNKELVCSTSIDINKQTNKNNPRNIYVSIVLYSYDSHVLHIVFLLLGNRSYRQSYISVLSRKLCDCMCLGMYLCSMFYILPRVFDNGLLTQYP